MQEMITANRLADGRVVFFASDEKWSEDFHHGAIFSEAAARAQALARAQASVAANEVVEPYPIELEMRAGHLAPKALRERIRATGPTVRGDFVKPARGDAPTGARHG
jgi:hypothetical protein